MRAFFMPATFLWMRKILGNALKHRSYTKQKLKNTKKNTLHYTTIHYNTIYQSFTQTVFPTFVGVL